MDPGLRSAWPKSRWKCFRLKNKYTQIIDLCKWRLIGALGKLLIDVLFWTTRIDVIGFEKIKSIVSTQKGILTFWHSRILLISYLFKGYAALALVSQSKDGEIMAQILEQQGYEAIRGSTSKGGIRALAEMIRAMRTRNKPAAIVPDGPRGPRFVVQPGVITLAQKTGYPIVPVTYSAKKMKIFSSWDRFILPYPFTRCRVIYGEPVTVPADIDKKEEEIWRQRLEQELCRITDSADQFFNYKIPAASEKNIWN